MESGFVSTKDVIAAALRNGIVANEERAAYASFLNAYDAALDGKVDGGFSRGQVGKDRYVSIQKSFMKDEALAFKTNRLISCLLAERTAKPKPDSQENVWLTVGKIVAFALLWPVALLTGCDNSHECMEETNIRLCPDPDYCIGEGDDEECSCPDGQYLTWDKWGGHCYEHERDYNDYATK